MKLIISNFKCHTYKEFDFGENGVVLISARSGVGKSSLLEAITYNLFGGIVVGLRKNNKKCCVSLFYKNFEIIRSNNPNNLLLKIKEEKDSKEKEYLNDEAQYIINNIFGNKETFVISSYLSQNNKRECFLSMNAIEKLQVVEKFLFENDKSSSSIESNNIQSYKDKIKELIKLYTDKLNKVKGKYQIIEEEILKKKEEVKVNFKKKSKYFDRDNLIIKTNLITKIKKYNSSLEKLKNKLFSIKLKIYKKQELQKKISEIKFKESKIDEKIKELSFDLDYFNKLAKAYNIYLSNKKYYSLKENIEKNKIKLNELKEKEKTENENKLSQLKLKLEDFKEISDILQDYTEFVNKIDYINSQIELVNKTKELKDLNFSEKEFLSLSTSYNNYLFNKKYYNLKKEIEDTEGKVNKLKKEELINYTKNLIELKNKKSVFNNSLLDKYTSELNKLINITKNLEINKYSEALFNSLFSEKNKLEEEIIESKISKKNYICPECKSNLKIKHDNLCKITLVNSKEDNSEKSLDNSFLIKQLKEINDKLDFQKIEKEKYNTLIFEKNNLEIKDLSFLKEEIKKLQNQKNEENIISSKIIELENKIKGGIFNSSIINISRDLEIKKVELKKFEINKIEIDNEINIEEKYNNYKLKNVEYKLLLEQQKILQNKNKENFYKNVVDLPSLTKIKEDLFSLLDDEDKNKSIIILKQKINNLQIQKNEENIISSKIIELENKIKNNIFSLSISELEKNINSDEIELKKIKKEENEEIKENNEGDIEEIYNNYKIKKINFESFISEKNNLIISFNNFRKEIEKYKNINQTNYDKIENLINTFVNKIKKYESYIFKLDKLIEKQKDYNLYKIKLNDYISSKNNFIDIQNEEKYYSNNLVNLNILKNDIYTAENIAITNIVDTINNYSEPYIEDFFVEDVMNVKLECCFNASKEANAIAASSKKRNNFELKMNISYKNYEFEGNVNLLSGGEYQRLSLVYTLALNELFNIPLILLDECTSALDQETTSSIINVIKEHSAGKLILIVAHQAIEGCYDKVIKLE